MDFRSPLPLPAPFPISRFPDFPISRSPDFPIFSPTLPYTSIILALLALYQPCISPIQREIRINRRQRRSPAFLQPMSRTRAAFSPHFQSVLKKGYSYFFTASQRMFSNRSLSTSTATSALGGRSAGGFISTAVWPPVHSPFVSTTTWHAFIRNSDGSMR